MERKITIINDKYSGLLIKYYSQLKFKIVTSQISSKVSQRNKLDTFCIYNEKKYEQAQILEKTSNRIILSLPYTVYPCLSLNMLSKIKIHSYHIFRSILLTKTPIKSISKWIKTYYKYYKNKKNIKINELNKFHRQSKKIAVIYPFCIADSKIIKKLENQFINTQITIINLPKISEDYFKSIEIITRNIELIDKIIILNIPNCYINKIVDTGIKNSLENKYIDIPVDKNNYENNIEIQCYYLLKELNNE